MLRRVGKWIVASALNVDLEVLRAAKWCVGMAEAWLSLSQRKIERALGIIFLAGYIAIAWHTWWILLFPTTAYGMWGVHRKPAAQRAAQLAAGLSIFWRLLSLANVLFFLVIDALAAAVEGFQWWQLPVAIVIMAYPCFDYVTALPQDSDRMGRRRKIALAKLKEMFGTSWLPLPQGGPA